MATPNYSYEKRQRELAKKRKAEEKRQKKLVKPAGEGEAAEGTEAGEGEAPADPDGNTAPPAATGA
ncbi:MAG: hypothetical protein KBC73_14120 [Burkholderiaceae bacterium]|nr:hypothetical protein [Burkholderiaceae bacterium]